MQESQVKQENETLNNDESDPRIEKIVNQRISDYKLHNGEHNPSGKVITQWRREAEISFIPLSKLIKRMFVIGNPDAVGVRAPQKNEFEMLALELDRREKEYLRIN